MTSKIVSDVACLRQRLLRLLDASLALSQKVSACIHRLTVLQTTLDCEDVANTTDRLHECFNAFSFLTRCNGWHDLDEEGEP